MARIVLTEDQVAYWSTKSIIMVARNIRENPDGSAICDTLATKGDGVAAVIDNCVPPEVFELFAKECEVIPMATAQERISKHFAS